MGMFFNNKDNDSKQRFGIRKLTIGACSVLLSTLILGIGTQEQTSKAQAATTDTSNTTSTIDSVDDYQSKNTYLTSSEVKEITNEAPSVNYKDSSVNNEQKDTQSAVMQDKENNKQSANVETKNSDLAVDKTVVTKKETSKTVDLTKNTVNSEKTTATNKETNTHTDSEKTMHATSGQLINDANKNIAGTIADIKNARNSNDISNLNLENTQKILEQQAKENDGKALDTKSFTSLFRKSNISNFQVLAASTKEIGEADEIKANAAVTIPSTDGRYTLYISRNTWGNTTDGNQDIKILLSGNVLAGDTVSISIPSYGIVGVNPPAIDPSYGNASMKDVGNDKVVTYNFITSGSY